MVKPLTDAELNALGKDGRWDSIYGERAIKELLALREQVIQARAGEQVYVDLVEQNTKLQADVALALGWDSAEQWTTAMAQIRFGQAAIGERDEAVCIALDNAAGRDSAIEQNAALVAALDRAHKWMVSTYDYEWLSPAGTAILKDEMLAAKLAIDGSAVLASVKGEAS